MLIFPLSVLLQRFLSICLASGEHAGEMLFSFPWFPLVGARARPKHVWLLVRGLLWRPVVGVRTY